MEGVYLSKENSTIPKFLWLPLFLEYLELLKGGATPRSVSWCWPYPLLVRYIHNPNYQCYAWTSKIYSNLPEKNTQGLGSKLLGFRERAVFPSKAHLDIKTKSTAGDAADAGRDVPRCEGWSGCGFLCPLGKDRAYNGMVSYNSTPSIHQLKP